MSLNLGLSVNDVVSVTVSLQQTAAAQRNFGSLLILGDSGVIDTTTRYRLYTSLAAVAGDYPTVSPEYLAAAIAFGQNPSLSQLYIGAWARTATASTLVGAPLTAAQQAITNFNGISTGGIDLTINGTAYNLSNLNFTSCTTLAQVAAVIAAQLTSVATVIYNTVYNYFQITTLATGATTSITFATPGAGTDVSVLTGLSASVSGAYTVQGIAAETPLAAATVLANMSNSWYGLMFAASVMPADSDYVAIAGFIQGASASVTRIFGVTTQEAAALNAALNTDIGSQLQALGYTRTFVQYSSSSPYACAGIFGLAFTVNFNGSNTLYTLKFDSESGVVPETLTETQASALNGKNINVFVNYNNGVAFLQQGQMASGAFFDVIHGTDWLQNAIQTALLNALILSGTKVPQTNAGMAYLVNTVTSQLNQAVTNGLVAPGVWTGPAVGAIVSGQTLSTGYYIYAAQISNQPQAARLARQAPLITACIKLAGAIHSASVVLNVNS